MQALASNSEAFAAFMDSANPEKRARLSDAKNVYDMEKDFELVSASVEKTEKEKVDESAKSQTEEMELPARVDDYPKEQTLYAPIDRAWLVINDGPIRFVGTNGLIGCVEVMIEYHAEREKGYLVAHVNSHIEDNQVEIRRQLGVMLRALSDMIGKEINWGEFTGSDGRAILTLVRHNPLNNEPRLFINMRNILAESGAENEDREQLVGHAGDHARGRHLP